ncbi:hypothetical protein [Streptomyces sp. NPDC001820]|uniref:hypothetical protein n=1 Tax=Streptomyces sp. NPDC001820 TaxID=3364613 RepID=UPI0036B670B5
MASRLSAVALSNRHQHSHLRTPPTKSTGTAMERVEKISAFALGRVALARYGQLSKAQTIERAPEPRRTPLLTAVVRQLEAQAVDDALDLFAVLMANRLISPARRASDRERLAAAAVGEGGPHPGEGVEDPQRGAGPALAP